MKVLNRKLVFTFCLLLTATIIFTHKAIAQAKLGDDRVMLQGFYWESYRHCHPDKFPTYGQKRWYTIVQEKVPAIRQGRFDLIWLPPPSYAGEISAGYNPREYYNLNNSYGNFQQQRSLLTNLLNSGVEPIADIVINHRDGSTGWTQFKNPSWGTWAITRNDEAFTNRASEAYQTPVAKRGAAEEHPPYLAQGAITYDYSAFRDIDHTNRTVRRDLIRYLLQLKSMGYRGWRYDMAHGYNARWIAAYNQATQPTFSVGEYDWGKHAQQCGWIWNTTKPPGNFPVASSAFDFKTYFTLKDNKGQYGALYGFGNGIGLIGDRTDGHAWSNKAVTFLENHDTGYRTEENRTPEDGHKFDSFGNGWQVEQAYAYILTHPGVPCVYWKHYFDWGNDLTNKITALINARKVAGVNAGSSLNPQDNARRKGIYAARINGSQGELYVRIGGSDTDWQPYYSNYKDYREYAQGSGWKVWVKLPNNPSLKQAPLKGAFPLPTYREPAKITVSDRLLGFLPTLPHRRS